MASLCTGWMRPRVGGMVRFGRSGDTWGEEDYPAQGTAGDISEDDWDYLAEAVAEKMDKVWRMILNKSRAFITRTSSTQTKICGIYYPDKWFKPQPDIFLSTPLLQILPCS